MDGTLVLHILLIVIFFLAVLACRMYCRKRNKHKAIRFMIARIHPLRVTPVLPPAPQFDRFRRTMSAQIEPTAPELDEYLPGTNAPHSAQATAPPESTDEEENQEDQISLESHVIPSESNIRTAYDIKSPPPPYSAGGDLPTYEEAIRWSQTKTDSENMNSNS